MRERSRRYPSDTNDEQWAIIEPLLPAMNTGGRPEKHPRRAIVDAILYVEPDGYAWRQLPRTSRRGRPCTGTSSSGNRPGVTEKILPVVRPSCASRKAVTPSPAPGWSTPSASRAPTPSGGVPRLRRRQEGQRPQADIVVDTIGLLLVVIVSAAAVQDRDGAKSVLLDTYLHCAGGTRQRRSGLVRRSTATS